MQISEHFQEGNTIRLTAECFDWDNVTKVDPTTIRFILYDSRWQVITSEDLEDGDRVEEGTYRKYIAPPIGDYYYEFYAEYGGLPSLKRKPLTIRKV